jgi:hypothetical protein
MKQYLVDLSTLSIELRQQVIKIMNDYAFVAQPILDKPNVFNVYWDFATPIDEKLQIPKVYITPLD